MKSVGSVLNAVALCSALCISVAAQDGFRQLAVLQPSNNAVYEYFGRTTSISGNVLVVGCSSAVCVFVKPAGGWTDMQETAMLTASDGAVLQAPFINGKTVVSVSTNGTAYVFLMPPTGWMNMTETAKLTASDGALFYSSAVEGHIIVAGAPSATVGSNIAQGAAYVFVEPSGGWTDMTQNAKLTASDGAANDRMSTAVAISGHTINMTGLDSAEAAGKLTYSWNRPGAGRLRRNLHS